MALRDQLVAPDRDNDDYERRPGGLVFPPSGFLSNY